MNDAELLDAKRFAANLRNDLTDPTRRVERQHMVDLLIIVDSLLVDRSLEDAKRLQVAARLAARTPGLVGVENERLKGELDAARADLAKREVFAQETERARAEDAAGRKSLSTQNELLRMALEEDRRQHDLEMRRAELARGQLQAELTRTMTSLAELREELDSSRDGFEVLRQNLSNCVKVASGLAARVSDRLKEEER